MLQKINTYWKDPTVQWYVGVGEITLGSCLLIGTLYYMSKSYKNALILQSLSHL